MIDLSVARLIHVAAAGALIVSTVGCAGKERRAAKLSCKAQKKCDEEAFEEQFDSVPECVASTDESIELLSVLLSDECFDAFLEQMICSAKAYRADCDFADVEDECSAETEAFFEQCADDYYDYYD